jgi:arabinofuranan 3-O-arabinosyltransferase
MVLSAHRDAGGAPFGLLPYLPALLLWSIAGLFAFGAAVRLWTKDWRIILLAAASPAALFGIMSGQFACFAAAIILAVLRWRESRPLLAGGLLGLLTVKPQLGLLFPVLLFATANKRAVGAAVVSTLVLAGLAALLWGADIWRIYVVAGIANQSLVLSDPDHLAGPFMPTLFMNLRVAGVSVPMASAMQGGLAILAVALLWWRFRTCPAVDLRANALFLACGLCATPYMLAYDTLALATMAVLLLDAGQRRLWPMLIFFLPLLQIVAGGLGVPGPGLIPMLFALSLASRQKNVMVN